MRVYYDTDADLNLIKGKNVAVIGYGSQGFGHANNLRDSGVRNVVVALRPGSASAAKAESAGFQVMAPAEAAAQADVVMVLVPDELQADLYREHLAPNLRDGAALAFAHGFNIHFRLIEPRRDLDVFMIAPKGPGHLVAPSTSGAPAYPAWSRSIRTRAAAPSTWRCPTARPSAAVAPASSRPPSARSARPICSASRWCCAAACAPYSERVDTLVEAGYAPEMAYFECVHEVKLIVDLIYEGGLANMRYSISNTAEYGDYTRGPRVITEDARRHAPDPGRHPKRRVRQGLGAREQGGPGRLQGAARQACRPPGRGGRAQAARHDAVDHRQAPGRQREELAADPQATWAPRRGFPVAAVLPSGGQSASARARREQ